MSSSPAVDTLVIPWAVRGLGFRGAMEIDREWMPKQQWDGATVRDLMTCVESRLDPKEDLVVMSLSLFGVCLKPAHELRLLLPALLEPFPCVLAVAQPASAVSMVAFTVKTLTGREVPVNCSIETTVEKLKELLEEETGYPAYEQRLVLDGRQLDEAYTLKQCKVEYGDVVYLVLRLRGGGGGSLMFADVSNDSLLTGTSFSSKAPEWRRCDEGLNIEGRCENRACDAFRHMVIHPHGFEPFNLIHEKTKCPSCRTKITPVTCGFYNCQWTFQGVRSSDGMRMSSPWKNAEGDRYHRFDATETSGSIEWSSLLITARPLCNTPTKGIGSRACGACADSLQWTPGKSIRTAACGHRFHQSCGASLRATQVDLGVLRTCLSCGNAVEDQ